MPQSVDVSPLGGMIMLCVPLYLILQIWFGAAWRGAWRLVALGPLAGFIPTLVISLIDLQHGSNLWPITMILFSPLGVLYLLAVAIAHTALNRQPAH